MTFENKERAGDGELASTVIGEIGAMEARQCCGVLDLRKVQTRRPGICRYARDWHFFWSCAMQRGNSSWVVQALTFGTILPPSFV